MPLYEYRCTACNHRFEKIQSFNAPEHSECPKCGSTSERLLSAPAIQFKGSGFYLTDYGKTGGAKSGANEGGSGSEGKPSTESKASTEGAKTGAPAAAPSSTPASSGSASGSSSAKPGS